MAEENGVTIPKGFFMKIAGTIVTASILGLMTFVGASLNDLKSAVDGLKIDIAVLKSNVDRLSDSDKEVRKYLERKTGWESEAK